MEQTLKDIRQITQDYYHRLSAYDQDFVTDITYMLENGYCFTERQRDHLNLILNRCNTWMRMDLKRTKDLL